MQHFLAIAKGAATDAPNPDMRRSFEVLHALWTLLLTSGLRISEALGLDWSDLDASAGLLHVHAQLISQKATEPHRGPLKSKNSRRTIPLSAQALEALEGMRGEAGWIFRTSKGTPYSARNINRAWGQAVARAALPRLRLHDARHTAVSLLLASGLDRYSVARHAGQTVATMEGVCAHVLPRQAQAVADVMTRLLQKREP